MNSVNKAKERLRKYPLLLTECRAPAGVYAKCIVEKSNLAKDDCLPEFRKFKSCLVQAAAKNKTKL
ncbi:NADH dehydrogenase [ubiquinone] 1 alpha subcomplex assembly factor 8 [Diachasmimorpha longicaudata]|uniref:NADH dehydrogenase [ubiquinone] 1 alpha subcomplex assembly factor 8 n=1 Tax=Diachasmimorpha longicaudata TaxID=58733 RepID=UPI0030B8D8F3